MNYAQDKATIKCDEYLLQAAFECRAGDTVKKICKGLVTHQFSFQKFHTQRQQ